MKNAPSAQLSYIRHISTWEFLRTRGNAEKQEPKASASRTSRARALWKYNELVQIQSHIRFGSVSYPAGLVD